MREIDAPAKCLRRLTVRFPPISPTAARIITRFVTADPQAIDRAIPSYCSSPVARTQATSNRGARSMMLCLRQIV